MTERQKREQSGERAMFSMHRGDSTGRLYFSFTPTMFQVLVTIFSLIASVAVGMRWYEDNVLIPRTSASIMASATPRMEQVAASHATKAELALLETRVDALRIETTNAQGLLKEELRYIRDRLDRIAERMGVR